MAYYWRMALRRKDTSTERIKGIVMTDNTIKPTKEFLLDHVLYEMQMYLYTLIKKKEILDAVPRDQLLYNAIYNANIVALRNLMSFFGISGERGKDLIQYDNFSLSEKPAGRKNRSSYYSPISKAINHITTDRFKGFNGSTLDNEVIKDCGKLFPEMLAYIYSFIQHLESDKAIVYAHTSGKNLFTIDITKELKDARVKAMVVSTKKLFYQVVNGLSEEERADFIQ